MHRAVQGNQQEEPRLKYECEVVSTEGGGNTIRSTKGARAKSHERQIHAWKIPIQRVRDTPVMAKSGPAHHREPMGKISHQSILRANDSKICEGTR